jgi:hypothetical protein
MKPVLGDKERIKYWETLVFRVEGAKLTGSGVLIDEQRILTAAHLSFKLGNSYKISGVDNQVLEAKCVFICKKCDFAILQSDKLQSVPLSPGSLPEGREYFIMVWHF